MEGKNFEKLIVRKLKNSNCDQIKKKKVKIWPNCDQTKKKLIVTQLKKLKIWQNLLYQLLTKLKCQIVTKLKKQSVTKLKTQIMTKLKNSSYDKTKKKTHMVIKLKISNYVQTHTLKLWEKFKTEVNQLWRNKKIGNVTKLKEKKCDQTQKSLYDKKIECWQNSNSN